jgi:uncharacterized protein YpiB (UPF0302 family)
MPDPGSPKNRPRGATATEAFCRLFDEAVQVREHRRSEDLRQQVERLRRRKNSCR